GGAVCHEVVRPSSVLPHSHGLEVVRTHTRAVAADVVDDHAVRDGPDVRLIGEAVDEPVAILEGATGVAVAVESQSGRPAGGPIYDSAAHIFTRPLLPGWVYHWRQSFR